MVVPSSDSASAVGILEHGRLRTQKPRARSQTFTQRSSPALTATAASSAEHDTASTPPACPVSVCPGCPEPKPHVRMRLSPQAARRRRPS